LNPRDARPHAGPFRFVFSLWEFQRQPSILRQVVFGSILAAMKIENRCGGGFLEGLSEKVNAPHRQRDGLRNPRATTLFLSWVIRRRLHHQQPSGLWARA
jgi:hypothetical protein